MAGPWNPAAALRMARTLNLDPRTEISLAPYSSIRIGGPAEVLATVRRATDLARLAACAQSEGQFPFVLGGGSNTLILDDGIPGLTVLNLCREVVFEPQPDGVLVRTDSGMPLAQLARMTIRKGLTGLEWAVSVPGTVGGAVVGNAGAHGSDTAQHLVAAEVAMPGQEPEWLSVQELDLAYRDSALKRIAANHRVPPAPVLRAQFQLRPGDPEQSRAAAKTNLEHRRRSQPVLPSLGSTFRNPPNGFAGALIEQAGCKNLRCGAVGVDTLHANFLVNLGTPGKGRAVDVLQLMASVQVRVRNETGVWLKPEIGLAGREADRYTAALLDPPA